MAPWLHCIEVKQYSEISIGGDFVKTFLALLIVSFSVNSMASDEIFEATSYEYSDYSQPAAREISTFAEAPQPPVQPESQIETPAEASASIGAPVAAHSDTADLSSDELADLTVPQSALAAKTASYSEEGHQIASVPSEEPGFQINLRRSKK